MLWNLHKTLLQFQLMHTKFLYVRRCAVYMCEPLVWMGRVCAWVSACEKRDRKVRLCETMCNCTSVFACSMCVYVSRLHESSRHTLLTHIQHVSHKTQNISITMTSDGAPQIYIERLYDRCKTTTRRERRKAGHMSPQRVSVSSVWLGGT